MVFLGLLCSPMRRRCAKTARGRPECRRSEQLEPSVCNSTNKENRYRRKERRDVRHVGFRKKEPGEGEESEEPKGNERKAASFGRRRDVGICMRLGRILTMIVIILWFLSLNPCLNRLIAVEKCAREGGKGYG